MATQKPEIDAVLPVYPNPSVSNTERFEGIDVVATRVDRTTKENLVRNAMNLLDITSDYDCMVTTQNPYGDGVASKRTLDVLLSKFDNKQSSR